MEMGIGQIQILRLLFGEQVLRLPDQHPVMIKITVKDLLMNMICMIHQHLMIGVSVILKEWMSIKLILHH